METKYKKLPDLEILYFKGDSNYTRIYFEDGSVIISSYTLKTFLSDPIFLRIHRTYIVNSKFIKERIECGGYQYCRLKNGEVLPISRRRLNSLSGL